MTRAGVWIGLLLVAALPWPAAAADLRGDTDPSCTAYRDRFPQRCRCDGDRDEYFGTYGLKYCNRFMANTAFSDAAARWRDRTLVCLQDRIAAKLDALPGPGCDCAAMRTFAFESHVDCYTQAQHSICRLQPGDVAEIVGTIDMADLLRTREGLAQALAVASKCASQAPQPANGIGWR